MVNLQCLLQKVMGPKGKNSPGMLSIMLTKGNNQMGMSAFFVEMLEDGRAVPVLAQAFPLLLVRACRVEGVAAVEYGVALLEDLLPHLINPRPW